MLLKTGSVPVPSLLFSGCAYGSGAGKEHRVGRDLRLCTRVGLLGIYGKEGSKCGCTASGIHLRSCLALSSS